MRAVFAIARKDLAQLCRDKVGFFFVFVFPILFGIMFGVIFSGASEGPRDVGLLVADLDASETSRLLIERLGTDDKLAITVVEDDAAARDAVRTGVAPGVLIIPEGFGAELENMFFGDAAELTLTLDPGKSLEGGVIRGAVAAAAYETMFTAFQGGESGRRMLARGRESLGQTQGLSITDRLVLNTFMNSLENVLELQEEDDAEGGDGDSGAETAVASGGFRPIVINEGDDGDDDDAPAPDARKPAQPDTAFEITFAQAVAWGLMSCVLGFGLGVVGERSRGTLTRLRLAPIAPWQIIAGKALGCLLTCLGVQVLILGVGVAMFGVRPDSWGLLALGVASSCIAFVGLAMLLASLGKSETATEGLSRAVLLVLALVGGAGVPLAFMPGWVQDAASISPFKWVIQALDGALWRQYTLGEVLAPCAVLVGIGVGGFVIGVVLFKRSVD